MTHEASPPERGLPERITRVLRHEVGDFLQMAYATIAILQRRLPQALDLERQLIGDLRRRAEGCRTFLDLVHDCFCPVTLDYAAVDVPEMAEQAATHCRQRFPGLKIQVECGGRQRILADPRRLVQAVDALLTNACEAAANLVWLSTGPGSESGQACLLVADDGPGVPQADVERIFLPFFTTRAGHLGLGLTLARNLIRQHGGNLGPDEAATRGWRMRVVLPEVPADDSALG